MREKEILKASMKGHSGKRMDVRACAIKFILTLIQHSGVTTRGAILSNRILMGPIIKFLPLDSDSTVLDVIECIKSRVVADKRISKFVKSTFFNTEQFPYRLATLYERCYNDLQEPSEFVKTIHEFLVDLCTNPGNGVCFEDKGWYPRTGGTSIDYDRLYNLSLFRFLGQLRTFENEYHRALTIHILTTCPELRAPYFTNIQQPPPPSLSLQYVYAVSLWREIIGLPLPKHYTDDSNLPDDPPPTDIIIENIMPSFLNKGYLANGLSHDSSLVRYATCQLILAILDQLQKLHNAIQSAGANWLNQFHGILATVSRRLPDSSLILKHFSLSSKSPLALICCVKVLSSYSEFLSNISSGQSIDAKAITSGFDNRWDWAPPLGLLGHVQLFKIIHQQSDVNWWSRQGVS